MGKYEINLAKGDRMVNGNFRYIHFGKLTLGTSDKETALAILDDTKARYPSPEWKVDLTYWTAPVGRAVA